MPRDEDGNWIDPYDVKLGEPILAGDLPPDTPKGRGWARSRAHWLNHNTFRARLWALGIDADPYWAMHLVAMYLEPLSLPENVWRSKPGSPTFLRELGMESGMIWLRVAGAVMRQTGLAHGPTGTVQGMPAIGAPSPDRPRTRDQPSRHQNA